MSKWNRRVGFGYVVVAIGLVLDFEDQTYKPPQAHLDYEVTMQ